MGKFDETDDDEKLNPHELEVDVTLRYSVGGNVAQFETTVSIEDLRELNASVDKLRSAVKLLQNGLDLNIFKSNELSVDPDGTLCFIPRLPRRRKRKEREALGDRDGPETSAGPA